LEALLGVSARDKGYLGKKLKVYRIFPGEVNDIQLYGIVGGQTNGIWDVEIRYNGISCKKIVNVFTWN